MMLTATGIGGMKREAKRQKKARGISHSAALDEQAKKFGFNNWALLMKEAHRQGVQDEAQTKLDEMVLGDK